MTLGERLLHKAKDFDNWDGDPETHALLVEAALALQIIVDYATTLRQDGASLRADTMVSIHEGICNSIRADDMDHIAEVIEALAQVKEMEETKS